MRASRMVPLLFLNFPMKRLFYSTIDINMTNIDLSPFYNYSSTTGINFIPRLMSAPDVNLSFDALNPRVNLISLDFEISNVDRLQDYEYYYPLETCEAIFLYYDLDKMTTVFRVIGKMSDIQFNKQTLKFTLQDTSTGIFIDQPATVLKEDTFQTIYTFGPFTESPLKLFGLLVDINPGGDNLITTSDGWPPIWAPVSIMGDDVPRAICVFIDHPSLYNENDDLYWIGSLVSIIEDPIPVGSSVERTGYLSDGITVDSNSPYQNGFVGWPSAQGGHSANNCLLSHFALGKSAYVMRNKTDKNAKYDIVSAPKRGRIWFDTFGPDLASWTLPTDDNRRLPNSNDPNVAPQGTPARWLYRNRTPGACAMGDIAQRHIVRIWRRCLPEGSNNAGTPFQIAYGSIKKGLAIHAIGGKAIGDAEGAGNDYYVFCRHPIASRVVVNKDNNNSYLNYTLQFKDIKIWHSLDEFVEKSVKDLNPYIYNKNEYIKSNNPFPRMEYQIFDFASNAYLTGAEYEPCVNWFIAGEDVGHRYPPDVSSANRQITLVDNYNDPKMSRMYSGIRLRGDEYWEKISALSESALLPVDVSENVHDPRYWIRNGLGSSNIYADFNGWPDFDDGLLTGVPAVGIPISIYNGAAFAKIEGERKNPAGLITNPADIIAHFLLNYTRINGDRTKIDWPSFRKTKGQLFNWKFSSLLDTATSGEEIISRWLAQCRCMLQFINNKFYLSYIDLSTRRKINYMFRPNNIERNSFNIIKKGIGGTYNKFTVRFKYYRPHDTWENSVTYDATNNRKCAVLQSLFNATDTFEFDCQDIRDYKVAKILTDYFVDLYAVPRNEVELTAVVNDDVRALSQGDMVIVQHPDLPNPTRIMFPMSKKTVDSKQYYMITQMNISDNLYKFKLLQLIPDTLLI